MAEFGSAQEFQEAAQPLFPPLLLTAPADRPYHAEMAAASVGPVVILRVACTPMELQRPQWLIGSAECELVKVTLHRRGSLIVGQGGRQNKVRPGDLVAYDVYRPYELVNPDPCEIVIITMPRPMLGPSADFFSRRTAIPLPSDQGIRSVIATFFNGLADTALDEHADQPYGPDAARLADTVASLFITAFTDTPCERAGLPTSLTDQILSYTLANLHDPGLSVGSVARRFRISPRYLHTLMRDRDIRFGAWVRQERMKRIRRDLLDPRLANSTAAAIAARWGIHDPDHLSRSLRAEFGCSAADIRASAIGLASRGS